MFMQSCRSSKNLSDQQKYDKAYNKFEKLYDDCQKDVATRPVPPAWSVHKYPLNVKPGKPETTQSRDYIPGRQQIMVVNCDSAFKAGAKSVSIKCPPSGTTIIHTTTVIHDSVESTAKTESMKTQFDLAMRRIEEEVFYQQAEVHKRDSVLTVKDKKIQGLKDTAKARLWWIIALCALIGLYIGYQAKGMIARNAIRKAVKLTA